MPGMTRSPLDNPFTPGYGNLPRVFAGREAEFADLELMGERVRRRIYEQARQVTGVRGIGKTALLREYAQWGREQGMWVIELTAVPGQALLARLGRELAEVVAGVDLAGRIADRATDVLRFAAGVALRYGQPQWHVEFQGRQVQAAEVSGDPGQDVERALGQVVDLAATRDTAVLLLIDEAQNADPQPLGSLLYALQAVQGRSENVTDGVSGRRDRRDAPLGVVLSGLPSLPAVIRRARATFMTRSRPVILHPLDDAAVREALPAFTAPLRVSWDVRALDPAIQLIAGYPYFMHVYGFHIFNAGTGQLIDAADVTAGVAAASPMVEGFYLERLEELTVLQRQTVRALAALSPDDRSPKALAAALGRRGGSQIGSTVEALVSKGLVQRVGRGELGLQLPGLDVYLNASDHLG